jgi:hypothetical protein
MDNLPLIQCVQMQLVYVIFQLLVGLLCFATLLGYIATIVTNISAARKDFQSKSGVFKGKAPEDYHSL